MSTTKNYVRDWLVNRVSDVRVYQDLMDQSRARPLKADAKLKVLGAGFSRTATLSMYAAMLELGYNVRITSLQKLTSGTLVYA